MAICVRFMKVTVLGLSLLLLAASCAFAQESTKAAQTSASEIYDPVGWAEEQAFYKKRQDQLLDHIKGAKNIEVAKGWKGVAPWPINWDAQQKFCHRIADVLFKEPQRLTFPEPQFSAYRDPAEKLRELPVAFPNCPTVDHDVEPTIRYIKKYYPERKATGDYSPIASEPRYYVEKNLLIQEFRDIKLRPPIGGWRDDRFMKNGPSASPGDKEIEMVTYDYKAGLDNKGCPLWGSSVMEDMNWDRAEDSKMILTKIDDEYVFIEIGTFDKDHGVSAAKAKAMGGWFSTAGKRYITATGVQNNLYYTLRPESLRPKKGAEYMAPLNINGSMQNWAEPFAYACVINFDGPQSLSK